MDLTEQIKQQIQITYPINLQINNYFMENSNKMKMYIMINKDI